MFTKDLALSVSDCSAIIDLIMASPSASGMTESAGKRSSSVKRNQPLEDDRTASVKKLHADIIDPSYVSPPSSRSKMGKSRGKRSSSVRGKHTFEDGKTASAKKSHVAFTDPSYVSPLASSSGMGSTGRRSSSVKQHARYSIQYPDGKMEFSFSDLVWGKVKSHPWWPGQIFDPLDASEMALKHRKEGKLLVAYFEDKTFAWNDKTQLKPFTTNFTEMEKQSKLVSCRNAVNAALEEIVRRVKVGLTCSCFADETYAAMKSKTVDNAGLQEGTCSAAVDRTLIRDFFESGRILSIVNSLAKNPVGGADRVELFTLKAQLKAFYHFKGCSVISVFLDGGKLMENDDTLTDSTKKSTSSTRKRKSIGKGRSPVKRKQPSEEDGRTTTVKKSYDAIDGPSIVAPPASISGKGKSRGKRSSSAEGRQTSEYCPTARAKSGSSIIDPSIVTPPASSSGKRKSRGKGSSSIEGKQTLEYGRTASVKKSRSAIIDPSNVSPGSSSAKGKLSGKGSSSGKRKLTLYDSRIGTAEKSGEDIIFPSPSVASSGKGNSGMRRGYSATTEVLAQLFLVATGPRKEYGFLPTLLSFFTAFRNLIVGSKRARQKPSRAKSASKQKGTAEDYWDGLIDRNRPEEDSDYSDVIFQDSPERRESKLQRMKFAGDKTLQSYSDVIFQDTMWNTEDSTQREVSEERTANGAGEKIAKEYTPTSLIMSFSESDSLPSVTDLINIFSRFGTLEEAETEVQEQEKRTRVVFRTRADAETAYRTAKSSFFGPASVSYRLKNL